MSPELRVFPSRPAPPPPEEMPSQISRSNRCARYEAIRTLHEQAVSQREIARRLKISRQTVHRFLTSETLPERRRPPYRGSILDPYKPYLLDRWKAGCWNGSQLYSEVKQLGYTGSEVLCRLFITNLRKQHQAAGTSNGLELSSDGAKVSGTASTKPVPSPKRRMSPTRASWFCMCQPDKLDEQQRKLVEQLRMAHPDLEIAYHLSQAFVSMLAERRPQDLDGWLLQVKQSGIRELKSFAQGIRRDYAAVRAAFTSKWSNGQTEAQVNCLKRKPGSCSAGRTLTYCGFGCSVVPESMARAQRQLAASKCGHQECLCATMESKRKEKTLDKVSFITTLQEARHKWKAVVAQMDEQRLLQPGVVNIWSVKDVIAHIGWYEREMIPVMRTLVFAGSELWELSTDERNRIIFQQNSQRPLQEILTEEEHIYADFFEAVQLLSEEDLNTAQRFKEMPEDWLPWQLFAENSFVHYQQHLPALRQWAGHG